MQPRHSGSPYRSFRYCGAGVVLVWSLMAITTAAAMPGIEVYQSCTAASPANPAVVVHRMDCARQLDAWFTHNYPHFADQDAATRKQQLCRYLHQYVEAYRQAFEAESQALAAGITAYPAVVIDHRYVVYGTTDTVTAQRLLQRYKREQP